MADRLDRRLSASSRSSQRRPASRSSQSSARPVDVFSDDNALDVSPVADGFAPADGAAPAMRERPRTPPRMSARRSMSPPPQPSAQSKPSDASKRRSAVYQAGTQNRAPWTSPSRSDTQTTVQRSASTSSRPEMSQRPISLMSNLSFQRAQGGVGADAPLHNLNDSFSLNRSSTGSTMRPSAERPYSGPSRPLHPYAMYSQATGPEMTLDPLAASRDITTIGFPGLNQGLARRMGPDGEDADDLVAADGYTEQLPPYTRYPDIPPSKERSAEDTDSSNTAAEATQVASARSGENTTETQAASSGDGDSDAPLNRDAEQDGEDNPRNAPTSRLAASKAKWARQGKRRFFGGKIPAWAICLGMVIIVALAITLGIMVGRNLPRSDHGSSPPKNESAWPETGNAYVTTLTTYIDATPLTATPSSLPPLATGSFGFDIEPPYQSSSACLTDASQGMAWGCPDDGFALWNVSSNNGSPAVSLTYSLANWKLCYGPQPPFMPKPIPMTLVDDVEQPTLGPAYYFQSPYTKTVVLEEDAFNSTTPTSSKRSLSKRFYEAANAPVVQKRDIQVEPGQKPWVCYWNNTFLEGFIYDTHPNLPSSLATPGPTSPATSLTSSMWSATTSPPTTPPPTSSSSVYKSSTSSVSTSTPGSNGQTKRAAPIGLGTNNNDDDDDSDYNPGGIPPYPKALKVSERRVAGNTIQPYCVQMNVASDLSMTPICDSGGHQITIQLVECEPEAQQRVNPSGSQAFARSVFGRSARQAKRDDNFNGACLCEWMVS